MRKSFYIITLIFLLSGTSSGQKQKEGTALRVLTLNILHGATTNGSFDLDRIAAVIKEVDPDLVALQEVDFKTRRAKNYDLATELGWRTKMAPLFGMAMPYDGGGYGEGILAKMPILASRNVPLPHSPDNEPRAALEILTTTVEGDTISFVGTHLEHQRASTDRIGQVKKINEVFAENKYPTILAGDLNDTPESEAIRILKNVWTDCYDKEYPSTFPSDNPRKKIDYILYRPSSKWEVLEKRVICDTIASDHCGLFVILRLLE